MKTINMPMKLIEWQLYLDQEMKKLKILNLNYKIYLH